ncbi:MAG: YdbL family protein, partial [Phycisphaerales bacterium]|nr:YdbL family protein [Phycisphaerales bacterium]
MMTMMTRTLPTLLALLMSLALVGSPAHAAPQSRSELKARFEQRMPQIDRLKDQGKIGESWTGYLEPVKGEGDLNEQSKKLVAEENADRKKLYAMIADDPDVKDGRKRVPAEKVAERNGRRNFRNADPDEFLKTRDGHWIQRSEIVQLKRDGKIGETWEGYLDIVDGESLSARQRAVFDE